jgi:hypothetical protein
VARRASGRPNESAVKGTTIRKMVSHRGPANCRDISLPQGTFVSTTNARTSASLPSPQIFAAMAALGGENTSSAARSRSPSQSCYCSNSCGLAPDLLPRSGSPVELNPDGSPLHATVACKRFVGERQLLAYITLCVVTACLRETIESVVEATTARSDRLGSV